ncbi:T9SS type A sorting domain-containing protein [Xanthomarina sp. F2636L]|uniref:T9SS type A sorting domain-containing protein n=1 Tax=Xanthomarina sp. F2636L TaxID=2996018 RepID=UPI00225DD362|nr:T9SS type A sorting domain-containing protein [Xanthomarina sp. F2636L]MCX7550994.1 T9SS type A sorting domain-containing protein [Xanthomarina sp. F2636L]
MKKQYLLILTMALMLFSLNGFSQTNDLVINETSQIEDLSIYPNPVSQGIVYITSKNNDPKQIEIYNVLGKTILTVTLLQKELNVSKLKAGVYIIKITENNISTTRKLVIR